MGGRDYREGKLVEWRLGERKGGQGKGLAPVQPP